MSHKLLPSSEPLLWAVTYDGGDRNKQGQSLLSRSSQSNRKLLHIYTTAHPSASIFVCQVETGTEDTEMNEAPISLSKNSQSREGHPWLQSQCNLIGAKREIDRLIN